MNANLITEVSEVTEFGLFVTSNASNSHILFGESNKTPCGLLFEVMNTKHPHSEVRFYLSKSDFKEYVENNRYSTYSGYRFCKKCLKSFDKLMSVGGN